MEQKEIYDIAEKYYYKADITTGFILGVVLDNIIPCTFGLITRYLKRFGRVWFSREIKYNNAIIRFFFD